MMSTVADHSAFAAYSATTASDDCGFTVYCQRQRHPDKTKRYPDQRQRYPDSSSTEAAV